MRLQPSLLDRLRNDEPHARQESSDNRIMSLPRLREAVIRDLVWLLNTSNFTSVEDLTDYPEVAESVINYGMPVLAGSTISSVNTPTLERLLKQAIINFEPRINKNSLKVRVVVTQDSMHHNAMNFDIEGELWAQPLPLHLLLRTEIDLDTGLVKVEERGTKGGG